MSDIVKVGAQVIFIKVDRGNTIIGEFEQKGDAILLTETLHERKESS